MVLEDTLEQEQREEDELLPHNKLIFVLEQLTRFY